MESGSDVAGGAVACVFMVVAGLLGIAMFGFWLWMLIDAISHTPSENSTKLIWILIIVFTGIIGALIYFFVQRPKNDVVT